MRDRRKNQGKNVNRDYLSNEPDINSRKMNYGKRVEGPGVFGIIVKGKKNLFYVPERSRNILFPILFDPVDSRSMVRGDQWVAILHKKILCKPLFS